MTFGYIFLFLAGFALIFDYRSPGLDLILGIVLVISIFSITFSVIQIRRELKSF